MCTLSEDSNQQELSSVQCDIFDVRLTSSLNIRAHGSKSGWIGISVIVIKLGFVMQRLKLQCDLRVKARHEHAQRPLN